ncbi:hypothetical protein A3B21_03125 [Candidatus Uhrbacteria bacterium RIFCSPLOWO2_01_FULL_47_24]|uniref:PDZ domain-containing protein n=1 Tax=Candidatus Uhrbacteria bacterium RIFCSPLOWO2_01_FULL_47_24 TaxID=1802401 RepID=A0A1F7URL1_9BACT|nr:MAG: hypothetical protein A2753_05050 [Candidatus Uhrbacteria bacterium RIFCSPHIGHO2_01_FULL_47_11]OGL67579.1 MAG: hypothetical protein A3D58_03725 [Candidatus Uhrbacteria bacterium RIFCSPHIGHO2_02_FULL_46_47]OGL75069.1 MAG: hypothetical protein A3F52_01555 [Candidatus Uhrbacteria bacterium RIFCSPHIGHO2_12_FULL_47_11]OGL80933.1 MAG: hypothetical protein A3B21_03125 [Candidatus Uhrbacteria bacterium RIFCSPLOWO2_01_FULL_47_24]OGL84268.1 MAG: hypothetical protein A3J03_03125 [Candidatus Uhrbact
MFYIQPKKSKVLRRFVTLYSILILIGISFLGGLYIGGTKLQSKGAITEGGSVKGKTEVPPYLLKDVDFDLFWDVWNTVKDQYLEQPVLDTELFYGAVGGIVASLGDPYSAFLDPEMTRKFAEELSGTFEGIGAEIGIKRDQLVIIAPLPETPAERAGLRAGDRIFKIDEKDTIGMPLDVAVSNIRGQKGTTVTLKILRNGWKEAKDIAIVRDTINVKSVTWKELQGGIAHIKVSYFNETTPSLFEEAVQGVLAKNPKGIILDLRNNPGGFFEVGIGVASQWIPAQSTVVFQEYQGGRREAFGAQGQARFKEIPTAVLINQGSASASEIVAGALQDYKAATLVGEKTFGKGSVQTYEQLRGGSSLKFTVAHWLTPLGRQIDKEGIAPDIEVKLTPEDYENDKDPQLDKAVELLK